MTDTVVRGAQVVDGTGRPGFRADVGITDGLVTEIGDVDTTGARVVEADGLVLAPGFVDVHTHYDAQVLWDGACTPSPLHGVTTVIGGNCGFTLGQAGPEHAGYLVPLLARVEGIPLDALEQGVDWSWRTTAEYFACFEGTLVPNAGFLAGHSAIRRVVMGERAVGENATDDDLDAMERILRQAIGEGALGFSSSNAGTHHDGSGDPVPSRFADEQELFRLSRVVGEVPGTMIEYIPLRPANEMARMAAMSLVSGRPLNWNVLQPSATKKDYYRADLASTTYAEEMGAVVKALMLPCPLDQRINLRTGFMFDALPGWPDVIRLPVPERVAALRDPAVRERLREGAVAAGVRRRELTDWTSHIVCEVTNPANAGLVGRTIGEIAAERGADPFDVLLDLSVSDDLNTVVLPRAIGWDDDTWKDRAELWQDPHILIGASDAGAHLDMISTFSMTTRMLGEAVRERQLVSLEDAVHLLTDRNARFYGLRGRGRVAEGWVADLVLFDPERVGPGTIATRNDLPAGAGRLYSDAEGIEKVLVAGREVVGSNGLTGDTPGTLLRPGRDTEASQS
jgi:N-acyl-D-aspartate/D-glutamate deacylase